MPQLAFKGAVELPNKSRLPLVLFTDQTNERAWQIEFAAADFGSHAVAVEASSGGNPPASAKHQWQRWRSSSKADLLRASVGSTEAILPD